MKSSNKIFFTFITVMLMASCKQLYNPPEIRQNPGFLVVDGALHVGADSSVILLSRTRNLDSLSSVPESQAKILVMDQSGQSYPLTEQSIGRYVCSSLNLNYNALYQLKINTIDGREYLSDTFHAIQTPPIDSIVWRQDSVGVSIYVNATGTQNDSRYYRWDYVETWKYQTAFQSLYEYVNGQVVYRAPDNQIYFCWKDFASTDIVIGSTSKLSANVLSKKLVAVVPAGSEKISIKYSINLKQYGISKEAYEYWQNVKKNTEQLGTLFDAQPSQLTGNIHCTTNEAEPVIGFISASTVQQKRIFISNKEVNPWYYQRYYNDCYYTFGDRILITQDQAEEYIGKPGHLWVLIAERGGVYDIVQLFCGDCREHGGVNKPPAFWQN
ncbi:MAG: DUF4249 domain-containing protein [Bacteroidetes bacterium]|nr:DUF4249 domain-containing protein [Bacteroidota bacterium]